MASAGIAKHWLPYDAYYKYQNLNRLMRYLAMTLGLLESYRRVGDGFRFDAFEPFRDTLLQTYLLSQNLLERSSAGEQLLGNDERNLMHPLERQHLLTCVQSLAGCVTFSGVSDERLYHKMCVDALEQLCEVQAFFYRAPFWCPPWVLMEESIRAQSENEQEVELEKRIAKKTEEEKLGARLDWLFKNRDREEQQMLSIEWRDLSEAEKNHKVAERGAELDDRSRPASQVAPGKPLGTNVREIEELKAELSAITNPKEKRAKAEAVWRSKRVEMKKYLRERHVAHETVRKALEKRKICGARDPVLYTSHSRPSGSYTASRRFVSANTRQKAEAEDRGPWNPWHMQKQKFLLSATRSIGVLRAAINSDGLRSDAFQPFLGSLRETFEMCEEYLKRNETEEEYLTIEERNALLDAIFGLSGCVSFTGVSRNEKYGVELAFEKLEAVVRRLNVYFQQPAATAFQTVLQCQDIGYWKQKCSF